MEEHCWFSCSLWIFPFKAYAVFFIMCFLWTFRPRFSGIWCRNVCVGTLEFFFSLKVSPAFAIVLLITSDSHQTLCSPLRMQEWTKDAQVTARFCGTIFPLYGSICTKSLINPLNAKLNPIYPLLVLLVAQHILHVSRHRVNPEFLWL